MFHDAHRSPIREQIAQEAIEQRNAPAEKIGKDGNAEFRPDQQPEVREVALTRCLHEVDYFIYNQSSDVQQRQRNDRFEEAEEEIRGRHGLARLPQQSE